jgi:hypothetical protein
MIYLMNAISGCCQASTNRGGQIGQELLANGHGIVGEIHHDLPCGSLSRQHPRAAVAELSFSNRNNAFVGMGNRVQILDRAIIGTVFHEDKFETEWNVLIQYGIDKTANERE